MALNLVQGSVLKISKIAISGLTKNNTVFISTAVVRTNNFSTTSMNDSQDIKESQIKKSVFISQSSDIFTNLAMEDWMYRNFDFTNHHVLFLWRNSPCVVIGRHQNPWLEANTENLFKHGIEIARRNSGGGTVYHDPGNLNMTFFTPRARYNRRNNLELISRALFREWGLMTEITPREDIVISGNYKQISGTASKLGRPSAYHHCTLLADVNKVNLSQALQKQNMGIATNATKSVPSPVMNLCEVNHHVNVEQLVGAVGWEYLRTSPLTLEDGGQELISKQLGFQLINPTDDWFPGLKKLHEEFSGWDWRYGKTPKFNVTRSFHVPQELIGDPDQELRITLEVTKGVIQDVTLNIPPGLMSANGFHGEANVMTSLRGQRFSEEAVDTLEESLRDFNTQEQDLKRAAEKSEFVVNCMKRVMKSV